MTAGLGGLGYTEDAVAAKLSLDLPNDSEQQLKHIAEFSSELRTNMEAISRFTGDYMSYIAQFPERQRAVNDVQREQLQILRETATAMEQIRNASGPGFVQAGGMPQQFNDAGRGMPYPNYMGPNGQRLPPGYERFTPGARPGLGDNPAENRMQNAQDEIDRQNAIRDRAVEREEARNRRSAARRGDPDPNGGSPAPRNGRHRRQDDDDDDDTSSGGDYERRLREGSRSAAGGIDDVAHLLMPGGSMTQRLRALASILGSGPDSPGGGGISGLLGRLPTWAKGAGIAGAAVGGLALANNAVQNIGEGIQSTRNLDLNNHSLAGGLGVQKDIMLMSLNPLLTNEQSREIIMGAMKSGYTGETYDSAVDFIKGNLIEMNMEVNKSVELLRSNVDLGNQSIESLQFTLLTNQGLANAGPKTTEGLNNSFMANNSAFTAVGVNAAAASSAATFANAMFNTTAADGSPNPLGQAGTDGLTPWDKIIAAVTQNEAFTSRVWQKYAPTAGFADTWNAVGENASQYIWELLKEDAKNSGNFTTFKYTVQIYGIPQALGDDSTLRSVYEQLIGKADVTGEAATQIKDENTLTVNGKDASTLQTFEQFKSQPGNENKTQKDYNLSLSGGTREDKPLVEGDLLRRIIKSDPEGKKVIVDPHGKAHLIDPNSSEQAIGLSNGTWKIVENDKPTLASRDSEGNLIDNLSGGYNAGGGGDVNKAQNDLLAQQDFSGKAAVTSGSGAGGDWTISALQSGAAGGTSQQDSNYQNQGDFSKSGGGGSFAIAGAPPGSTGAQIGLSAEAKKLFQFLPWEGNVPSDPNTAAANSGFGGAQTNDSPPAYNDWGR